MASEALKKETEALDLSAFLAENAMPVENQEVVASKRFRGKDGKPAPFVIRAITSEADEKLRSDCMSKVPIAGKPGRYTMELDSNRYLGLLAAACTVFPDLKNAKLQDDYHVMEPDRLLKTMLLPGEYAEYLKKIQEINGFDVSMDDLKKEAKN